MVGSPLGEAVLCHLVFGNPMVLFKVLQDVYLLACHLLACHLLAILLVLAGVFSPHTFTQ